METVIVYVYIQIFLFKCCCNITVLWRPTENQWLLCEIKQFWLTVYYFLIPRRCKSLQANQMRDGNSRHLVLELCQASNENSVFLSCWKIHLHINDKTHLCPYKHWKELFPHACLTINWSSVIKPGCVEK